MASLQSNSTFSSHPKYLQAEFRKFLFGYLEVVVAPANWISKIEIALWRSGMDLSTVNLQAEFRKFLLGYPEVVVAPANWISRIEIARKSKLLYGDLGKDLLTVNLQAEFRKFYFGYVEVVVVVAPANWISKIEIALCIWRSGKGPLNS